MIRTFSQMQKAAKATPIIDRAILIPPFYPGGGGGGNANPRESGEVFSARLL
jgi:hypothetical protein